MAFGLFKKKKEVKEDSRYLTLRVREVIHIAKDSVNLIFEKPEREFEYSSGQFITLIMTIDGQKIRRAYSLCTSPFEDEFPGVTVKRVPGGIMSNYVNDHTKAGDEIEVMEPMGMFTTSYDSANKRQALFFGGGSGITPLISLIRSILNKEPESQLHLVYGNRTKEYIAFHEEINQLVSSSDGKFKVTHVLEDDPDGIAFYTGRPTPDMIGSILNNSGFEQPECYICGPQPMMDTVTQGLEAAGILSENIKMESFEAGKTAPNTVVENGKPAVDTSEVTILMDGEEHVIEVKSDQSILEAGLENDLDMPYSCQSGLCTACRGKCLEGEVTIEESDALSQDELDEGYRLLCIGKPGSKSVKVEVG